MLHKRFGDVIGEGKRQRLARMPMDMHMLRLVLDVKLHQLQESGVGIMAMVGYVRLADLLRPIKRYMSARIVEGFMLL